MAADGHVAPGNAGPASGETSPLLEMCDVSFTYPGGALPVIEHLDLAVRRGEFLVVGGASGCGKSTLLRLACRLNAPDSGTILFGGTLISAIPPAELRSRICLVAQIPQMVDATVADNLLIPFSFAANRQKAVPMPERIDELLKSFYLNGVSPGQSALRLSTGQKQRLALMRALLLEPRLLLLDEPTSALDAESARMVFSIIERLNSEGMTVVMVTHSDYRPSLPGVRLMKMRNGKLVQA
jgi:putative ABC transport system ATP-binding protein